MVADTRPAPMERIRCLLTDLHPERGLASTLRRHLSLALASFDFTLEEGSDLDAIWVYGYEPHDLEGIRALRERHPRSVLLVTSGSRDSGWAAEALAAGADHALDWPCSVLVLSSLLAVSTRELTIST